MRATGQKDYTPLLKGLITEASPLTFPEGATSGEINFTIDRDGMLRKRRLGFSNLVDDFVFTGAGAQLENVEYWRGPGLIAVLVTNAAPATYLRFHAVDDAFTQLVQITVANDVCFSQIAQTTDRLVITFDKDQSPILCSWDQSTQTIDVSEVSLFVRDFELVDDDLTASQRPSSLTENHKYNIYNSGWYAYRDDERASGARKQVAQSFKDYTNTWPSNADVPSVGYIINTDGDRVFDPDYVKDADLGNSLAARGHFVYNIEDFDRTARNISFLSDGAPSTTVTSRGTVSLSGVPTYSPDEPDQSGTPSGGGGVDPYDPREDIFPPFGGENP